MIFGSLFPPFYAANAEISFDVTDMAYKVNKAGLFIDLFYVVVVISLFGICNILYTLINEGKPHIWVGLCFILSVAYFLYIILYGTGMFSHMASDSSAHKTLSDKDFISNGKIILTTMCIGLMTEFVLAFRAA